MSVNVKPHRLLGPLPFYKTCLQIALPVMAQQLIQNLVTLIDNFMVAGLGDVKMSGVNIAGQISFIFLVMYGTLYASGGIFMSQYNGAKDKHGMQQAFRFKIITCGIAGIGFTFLSLLLPYQLLSVMVHGNSARESILEQGVLYMQLLAFAWIPTMISGCISSSLREIGRVKPPLVISVCATIINTFFNWIFIYGNLGAPRLEVQGAALATVIARVTEMALFLLYAKKVKPPFFSRIRDIFRIQMSLFRQILSKSGLIFITDMTWVFCETVTTALYNSRGGAEIVSGMAAGFNIANLLYISFGGIFTVIGVVLGGTLGSGKLEEGRIQARWLLSGSLLFGIFTGALGSTATLLIPVVYGNLSAEAQSVTHLLVLLIAAYMPVWAYVNAQFGVGRTGGDAVMGVVIDITVNALIFLPGMFILTFCTALGPVSMYGLVKLSDFIKIWGAQWWLKKEHWLKNLTVSGG